MKKSLLFSMVLLAGLALLSGQLTASTLHNADDEDEIKSTLHTDPDLRHKAGGAKTAPKEASKAGAKKETKAAKKEGTAVSLITLDEGAGKILVAKKIAFDDANALTEDSKPTALALVQLLKSRPDLRTRVIVHTDSLGSDQKNLERTQKTAQSLGIFLIQQGIDMSRFELVGMGDREPIADDATAEGREKNRRVEFFLIVPVPAAVPPTTETPAAPVPAPETAPAPVAAPAPAPAAPLASPAPASVPTAAMPSTPPVPGTAAPTVLPPPPPPPPPPAPLHVAPPPLAR